jgi:DNA-binding winged helix-turn-helix (wHTH) protein
LNSEHSGTGPLPERGARTGAEDGRRGLLATAEIFLFEDFRLDRKGEGLSHRDGRGIFVPVSVGPRALDVLAVLVERSGQLVLKEEIMAAVWGRTVVENANLTVQISTLRRILDQGRAEGSCIQTVATRGYRFVAPVTRVEQDAALAVSSDTGGAATVLLPEHAPRAITISGAPGAQAASARTRQRRLAFAGLAVGPAVVILVAAAAWWPRPPPSTSAPATADATARPTKAPHLSIVVLPFADLSEGGGQQYFADGVSDDLTTDLSRLAGMFVIARNTAFTVSMR